MVKGNSKHKNRNISEHLNQIWNTVKDNKYSHQRKSSIEVITLKIVFKAMENYKLKIIIIKECFKIILQMVMVFKELTLMNILGSSLMGRNMGEEFWKWKMDPFLRGYLKMEEQYNNPILAIIKLNNYRHWWNKMKIL